MRLNRRTFLQQAGLAGLMLGIGEIGLLPGTKHYQQALAQPTKRKLALLVGINDYPQSSPLRGCLTDVELQQELLIHRFGFNPQDILTLTGSKATREAIETAFVAHLIEQAIAADVVVFHFSGYGSQVKVATEAMEKGLETNQLESSWVNSILPVDGIVSSGRNDLLESTLALLWRSLATEKATAILDTSYLPGEGHLQGNLTIRSFPQTAEQPSPAELAFQDKLRGQKGIFGQLKQNLGLDTTFPGTLLSPAAAGQLATEVNWNGVRAGLFTYALTQYLWQVTPASTIWFTAGRVSQTVAALKGEPQQSLLITKDKKPQLSYYLVPESLQGAEGVITAVEDSSSVQLQLTGLPVSVWDNYGLHSCYQLMPTAAATAQESEGIWLQIYAREGLKAKGKLVSGNGSELPVVQVGQQVQEWIRILPRHLGLTVALAPNLARIERVDATSAFANIEPVASVITAGEQGADCLLAKVSSTKTPPELDPDSSKAKAVSQKSQPSGYGLFSVGGILIPGTVGTENEAVKSAVERLTPPLKALLGAKLWRLTVNEGSSRLRVRATLERTEQNNQILVRRETLRSLSDTEANSQLASLSGSPTDASLATLPLGTPIQLRVENSSARPIYLMLLGIDSSSKAFVLYSPHLEGQSPGNNSSTSQIPPQSSALLNWKVASAVGLVEIQLICSTQPFPQTLATLAAPQSLPEGTRQVLDLPNPLEVAQAVLADLHEASIISPQISESGKEDRYALDVNNWATLSFVYQVV